MRELREAGFVFTLWHVVASPRRHCARRASVSRTCERWASMPSRSTRRFEAVFDAKQLHVAGFRASWLCEAGFEFTQLHEAGFPARELSEVDVDFT